MALVLAFGVVLLVSVSLSGLAARTVLSTALMFLLAGALLGQGGFGLITIHPTDPLVSVLADLALFTVLFTDGQRANLPALKESWRLSGRALGVAMPLTMAGIAVPAHFLAGLDWPTALLLGAILSPTDPVFASAIVGRSDVPARLRRLLNVESGLNDGLALPFVLVFLALAAHERSHPWTIAAELGGGLALGIVVPAVVTLAWRLPVLTAEPRLQVLGPLAIAVLLYATCHLTHVNAYLAAFAAGSTLATINRTAAERFEPFGGLLSELTKFAALLVFGALITPSLLGRVPLEGWVLAVLAIVLVRPVAMLLSLLRTRLSGRERATAAWFGPKGFASVVYGLLALQSGIPASAAVFDLVAVTIALSIVLHSSTDVPIARALRVELPDNLPGGQPETASAPGSSSV
ncbi:cation:proton antiporter [Amycolatopsis thermophila]|uniref:NhaP-type Na+/H+ or K+/H+ antiporter n=1 Tax=Amycolatopsis thermophila TaxID=206084 RepID=A0ABU0F5P5_9PSEU|nr:cation:proton antiporter [Amycolatopsis thermophila]MDQ0382910.1 NhaP-type Na+/H+ or K+/H+ antiporter [Amycolatopsis thermophila]